MFGVFIEQSRVGLAAAIDRAANVKLKGGAADVSRQRALRGTGRAALAGANYLLMREKTRNVRESI